MAQRKKAKARRFQVGFSPAATAERKNLPAPVRAVMTKIVDRFYDEGCRAMGYALTGDLPWPKFCCTHFASNWRIICAFPSPSQIVVVKIAPHTGESDPYLDMAVSLEEPPNTEPVKKGQCCEDGVAPILTADEADHIYGAFRKVIQGNLSVTF